MKPVFNPYNYGSDTVMSCPDKESALIFLQHLHECGLKWVSGRPYTDEKVLNGYPEFLAFRFREGTRGSLNNYKARSYIRKILYFEDFDWRDDAFTEEDTELSEFLNGFA